MPASLKRIIPVAAAAALCAAAVPVFAHPTAHLTADRSPAGTVQADPVQVVNLKQAITLARLDARPARYTVQPGDTLSSIAGQFYARPSDWPVLYWANHLRWADVIEAGQVLSVPPEPASIPAAPAQLGPPAPRPAVVLAAYTPAPAGAAAPATAVSYTSTAGESSFQKCVIGAESGGDATAVNPRSGAGGLYGFLPSTWASLGYSGLPEDAPVAEQDAAFAKEYALYGTEPWEPEDGCSLRCLLAVRPAGDFMSGRPDEVAALAAAPGEHHGTVCGSAGQAV